jgi:hypothetical protein
MFKLVLKKFQDMFKKEETIKTGLRISRRKLGFEILEGRELLSAGGFSDNYIYDSNEYEQSSYYESGSSNYSLSQTSGYFTQSSGVTIPDALYSYNQDIVLDGTGSSFITISDTSDLDTISSQVTFRSVFTAASTSGFKYLIAHDVENNVGKELFMRIRNGNLQFGTWTGVHTGGTNYLVETAVTVGQTYDAIGTYDGQYWRLYLNGELVSSLQDVGRDISVPSDFNNGSFNPVWLIGAHGTPTDRRIFNGTIQGVEIFDTALTSEQITALHEQKDDWTINLSGPTTTNGVTPIFAETTQDSFNVTITRENAAINADKTYPVEVRLVFSGSATKDDFQIFDGTTLISDNTEDWLNNDTVFLCYIPAGETSLTLTFKLIDNQIEEDVIEDLTISVSSASANINGTDKNFTCGTNTVNVEIKNDLYNVKWQTIAGIDANKATVSDDSEGRGQRVFPETSIPQGNLANKFELVFELEAVATEDKTLHFKIFDPDNFIGLGKDTETATAWKGNDNYATTSMTTGSVTIAQGATSVALTIVVYPADYTGNKIQSDATTIIIDSAHAGDNFIVVIDTNQTEVNTAQLGTAEATRYKETTNSLTQSELLTVWRTLNVERDVATWDNMPKDDAGNPLSLLTPPIDSFVASELARACIAIKEYFPNVSEMPTISSPITEDETTNIIQDQAGRDSLQANNKPEFWTLRIVTVTRFADYSFKLTDWFYIPDIADDNGNFNNNVLGIAYTTRNVVMLAYERHKDIADNEIWDDEQLTDALRQTTLHEIGHILGLGHVDNNAADGKIMRPTVTPADMLQKDFQKFSLEQIKTIQAQTIPR